jgi:hypothetical protein
MSGRIRGHYRIDSAGRVEPLGDVNASLQRFVYQPALRRNPADVRKARLTKICVAGFTLCTIGLGLMASLPTIQRMIISAESSRMASIRKQFLRHHPGLDPSATIHPFHRTMADLNTH